MARPRKSIQAEDQTLEQAEESLSLTFEEATDVVAPEKPSRLKSAFKQVFTTTDDDEKPAKSRRKKKSVFWQETATPLVIGGLLWTIHLLVPDEYKEVFYVGETAYQFMPTEKHLQEIITPLARIADRHSPDVAINPDLLDLIACGQASFAYGMELRATMILKAHIDKKAREEKKADINEVWRNRLNGYADLTQ